MTKLGIIGAMACEVEALKGKMENVTVGSHAGSEYFEGTLEGLPAVVVQCGVGKVNAAMCVQVLCDFFAVTNLVNTGVAGSLCVDLDIGDFVIGKDAIYHDFKCSDLNPAYVVGQVPGLPVRFFPADETMVKVATEAAQLVHKDHVMVGTVASGDQFISDKQVKAKIIADTGAYCTEMEGAAIAHAAWRNQVPFVIIRAISDKADDSAQMDYPTFEAIAAERCARVTQNLARMLAE